jgi:pyridoxal phosphate enzyme (YggS family)
LNPAESIASRCRRVFDRIEAAARRSGRRPESIRLLAVTKTVPPERIREAIDSGIRDIGESRLQEALSKRDDLRDLPIAWHFIGRIQGNKAKRIAESFDWAHSVDRADIAEKLNAAATRRIPVLIEVNVAGETAKGGVAPEGIAALAESIRGCARLDLRGLMTVPPQSATPDAARPFFRRLRDLAKQHELAELSMGMSHDFEIAIEEGATIVRVGTALFGERG